MRECQYDTLVAIRDFCVDGTRQSQHEGFRIARIASNFLSDQTHDSDQAAYVGKPATEIRAALKNQTDLILTDPPPMGGSDLFMIHNDSQPRPTPTLVIRFSMPQPGQVTPQGFTTFSTDPMDDNVDLWGNWEDAASTYANGETIGQFSFELIAMPPGPVRVVPVPAIPRWSVPALIGLWIGAALWIGWRRRRPNLRNDPA